MHASGLGNRPTNIDHVVQSSTSNGETSVKTLLTGKAYTPSYATDIKATIRREQKRLREQERQRQKDGQEARNSKVKPLIKVTA